MRDTCVLCLPTNTNKNGDATLYRTTSIPGTHQNRKRSKNFARRFPTYVIFKRAEHLRQVQLCGSASGTKCSCSNSNIYRCAFPSLRITRSTQNSHIKGRFDQRGGRQKLTEMKSMEVSTSPTQATHALQTQNHHLDRATQTDRPTSNPYQISTISSSAACINNPDAVVPIRTKTIFPMKQK